MWKQTKPTYTEYHTEEVSEQEASAHANVWEKFRKKALMSTGKTRYFDHYEQQLYVYARFNPNDVTKVVSPKLAIEPNEMQPMLSQNIAPVSDATALGYGKFLWQDGNLVMINVKNVPENIATYYITIEKEIEEIEVCGVKSKYSITITTCNGNFTYLVEQKNLYKLNSLLLAEHPECYVISKHDDDFKTYIWLQFQDFLRYRKSVPYKILRISSIFSLIL